MSSNYSETSLEWMQERSQVLQPYLITKAEREIIGKSRYAMRLLILAIALWIVIVVPT
ncbi:MAG: hypothetical protein ACK54E_11590 [Pseudanabaena sp.]|jgi:hypothetical protein